MMCLLEPMEARLANLEKQVHETDIRDIDQSVAGLGVIDQYLNQQLWHMNGTLISLAHRMHIVEEITKN